MVVVVVVMISSLSWNEPTRAGQLSSRRRVQG